jgi:hypothetical protein
MRVRGVGAMPFDPDVPAVGGREQRPRLCRYLTYRDAGLVVERENGVAQEFIEQPIFDHDPAATATLFGGLEDQMHRALEIPVRGEVFGGAEQHRRVPVMTTSVHLAIFGRTVREFVQLLDRQRVHIGAQPDRRWRVAAPDSADDAGAGKPTMDFAAKFNELCRDQISGAALGKSQFGMSMDVVPDLRQLV